MMNVLPYYFEFLFHQELSKFYPEDKILDVIGD
jgi:hypothetical protein